MVSTRFWYRFDMTKNKSYTISKVSRNLYRELPDPVNITYYLSNRLKTVHPAPGEIEDTLREYAAYSKGKITFSVRDPARAGVTSAIDELGLTPRQIQTVEQDQASVAVVYSGIVIEYLDRIEVIPWLFSTDTLEYDITSKIRSMITGTERWIGVIVGDSYRQWREDFRYLGMTFAEAGYRVRPFYPGEEIPDDLPALFVLGGSEDFDNWVLYRIDRYIQMGGKVFFAVKSIYVDTVEGSLAARRKEDRGLLDMIASYGVIIRPELALDRNALSIFFPSTGPGGQTQFKMIQYPLWIGIPPGAGNPNHPVSVNFEGLDLFWASPLEIFPRESVNADILFSSSPEAWSMRGSFYTNPDVRYMLEADAAETTGTKILGVSMNGYFPSFFRGAPKPVHEYFDEELPDMPHQARLSRIIVVGDTDFASDIMSASQGFHNLEFLLRAADWLISDDDIIHIRNRQPQAGRFDKIKDIDSRVVVMMFVQILNVGLVPLMVIAAGFFMASQRKKRARLESKPEKENADDL